MKSDIKKLKRAFRLFERGHRNNRLALAAVFAGWRRAMGNQYARRYIRSFVE